MNIGAIIAATVPVAVGLLSRFPGVAGKKFAVEVG